MKKLFCLVTLLLAFSVASFGATCGIDTLANYLLNYGPSGTSCTIGDLTFSNFTATLTVNGLPTTITNATGVALYPTDPATTPVIGFNYNLSGSIFSPSGSNFADLNVVYTQTASGASILGVNLSNVAAGVTGGGSVTITDSWVCGSNCQGSSNSGSLFYQNVGNVVTTSGTGTFTSPTSSVILTKDINVQGGGDGGNSHVSGLTNGVVVPEPMTMSLLGVGLLGLGFFGRRLRK